MLQWCSWLSEPTFLKTCENILIYNLRASGWRGGVRCSFSFESILITMVRGWLTSPVPPESMYMIFSFLCIWQKRKKVMMFGHHFFHVRMILRKRRNCYLLRKIHNSLKTFSDKNFLKKLLAYSNRSCCSRQDPVVLSTESVAVS